MEHPALPRTPRETISVNLTINLTQGTIPLALMQWGGEGESGSYTIVVSLAMSRRRREGVELGRIHCEVSFMERKLET